MESKKILGALIFSALVLSSCNLQKNCGCPSFGMKKAPHPAHVICAKADRSARS